MISWKRKLLPWLFILPSAVGALVFRYYTIAQSAVLSFQDYHLSGEPGLFVGLQNYLSVVTSQEFQLACANTLVYVLLVFVLTFFIPLIQAVFLSEIRRGRGLFSTVYLIPAVIPLSVVVVLWKWIWHPDYGLANALVVGLGADPLKWLGDPELSKFAIVFPGVIGGGIVVLIYLSAILGVNKEIYEAAEIDGCSGLKRIFHITLPNITFIIRIQFVIMLIATVQILDAPYQFTLGGPAQSSSSLGIYIYNQFNEAVAYGKASAASMLMLAVIALATYLQLRTEKAD